MRSLIFLSMIFLCSTSAFAQLQIPKWAGDANASEADLLRGITTTDEPAEAQAAYRNLFGKIGPDGIHRLLTNQCDSIALRAAWQEVNLTVPEREPAHAVAPDRHKLDWFIGFLEGRVRISAPQWWTDAMLDSKANRRDNIYPGMEQKRLYHAAGLDSLQAPLDTTLEAKNGEVILHVGRESISIPAELLSKSDEGKYWGSVSACVSSSRCYLAIHDDVGYPYTVACLDRSSGKVRWKVKAWGSWIGGAGGTFQSWIAVTEQDGRIIVFGVASTGFHVEGFDADSGKNLFRVSNSY